MASSPASTDVSPSQPHHTPHWFKMRSLVWLQLLNGSVLPPSRHCTPLSKATTRRWEKLFPFRRLGGLVSSPVWLTAA
ncbi:MFS transporter [Sesbania bispinosa]|nr:MFS transporter [Sesbania bispinosa]